MLRTLGRCVSFRFALPGAADEAVPQARERQPGEGHPRAGQPAVGQETARASRRTRPRGDRRGAAGAQRAPGGDP
eukprot:4458696-Pyramimonas_sp.AAC.1